MVNHTHLRSITRFSLVPTSIATAVSDLCHHHPAPTPLVLKPAAVRHFTSLVLSYPQTKFFFILIIFFFPFTYIHYMQAGKKERRARRHLISRFSRFPRPKVHLNSLSPNFSQHPFNPLDLFSFPFFTSFFPSRPPVSFPSAWSDLISFWYFYFGWERNQKDLSISLLFRLISIDIYRHHHHRHTHSHTHLHTDVSYLLLVILYSFYLLL